MEEATEDGDKTFKKGCKNHSILAAFFCYAFSIFTTIDLLTGVSLFLANSFTGING
ncbi:MAG: hypothetical protein ACI9LN_002688, partial [Saprospiraceae bacterium]